MAKKVFEKIKRGNAAQRIQIAKDVITWVKAGKVRVSASTGYVSRPLGNDTWFDGTAEPVDAREALCAVEGACTVCARGALLLAMVDRFDVLKIGALSDLGDEAGYTDGGYLDRLFSRDKEEIEAAFEGFASNTKWVEAIPNASDRIIAIMRNIIRNKGRFKIDDVG